MAFKKGQSGNLEGRPKKQSGGLAFGVSASSDVPQTPVEKTKADREKYKYKWIDFGIDNLFPNALALITRRSPIHRGIINNKTAYVIGSGFVCKDLKTLNFIENVNSNDESLKKVMKKLSKDFYTTGNCYLEFVPYEGGFNLYHIDSTKVRLSSEKKTVLIHPDWSKAKNTQDLIIEIPIYNSLKQVRSVIHFKDYELGYTNYGVPSWIAAMDSAAIGYKTNKWNISRLDNSFQLSGVVTVESDMSTEDAITLKDLLVSEMTGEGKQGKLAVVVKPLGGEGTSFTPIASSNDADWTQLHIQSTQGLIIAHNWFRSLSGLSEGVSLGNTQQIRNEYQLAINTVITNDQEFLLEEIRKVLNSNGYKADDLLVVNKSPIPITDLLDPKTLFSVDEQRALFGYEKQEGTKSVRDSLNGIQVTAMQGVATAAALSQISIDSARQILIVAFSLTAEEAAIIVPDKIITV